VHDMAAYYESNGVDVRTLDTASRAGEIPGVESWLKGDSSTPRVLVVHCRYAIMYNFAVVYLILWPVVSQMAVVGEQVVFEEKPMTQSLVNQAVARTGRGIVSGSGALVMGPDRMDEGQMSKSEKFCEYMHLVQSYIRPRETEEWAEVREDLPHGMTTIVAQRLRKVNLPPQIAMRYLASDGKFAQRFHKGLCVFTQTEHRIPVSEQMDPVGYDMWVKEPLFGGGEDGPMIEVPLRATGEIQVVLQAITAISEGKIAVAKWRPPVADLAYELSADEGEPTALLQRRRLRRVRSYEKLPERIEVPRPNGWTLPAIQANAEMGGQGTRSGVVLNQERMREALIEMNATLGNYYPREAGLDPVPTPTGVRAEVVLPKGDVESPGGTVVCEMSGELCRLLNSGRMLGIDEVIELVQLFRMHGNSVVMSRVFDCFGHAWTAVLKALQNDFVVGALIAAGLSSQTYEMLHRLSGRFTFELVTVAKNSNVYKKRYMRIFKVAPTMDKLMRAVKAGKFRGMAQSDAFLDRVVEVKQWLDESLVVAERNGVYLPHLVTEAQRVLPVQGQAAITSLASGDIVERAMLERKHRRVQSNTSSRRETRDVW